jgi:hypothetical protein
MVTDHPRYPVLFLSALCERKWKRAADTLDHSSHHTRYMPRQRSNAPTSTALSKTTPHDVDGDPILMNIRSIGSYLCCADTHSFIFQKHVSTRSCSNADFQPFQPLCCIRRAAQRVIGVWLLVITQVMRRLPIREQGLGATIGRSQGVSSSSRLFLGVFDKKNTKVHAYESCLVRLCGVICFRLGTLAGRSMTHNSW